MPHKRFVIPEEKLFRQRWLNMRKYTPEQIEMMMYQMATYECSPNAPSARQVAMKMGIAYDTYIAWKSDPRYIAIMQKLLNSVRDKWEGRIQGVVIKKALTGSKYHIDTYYNLQGRFTKKVEVVHKESIPTDAKEIQEEINRLTAEISDLETVSPVSKSVEAESKVARMPKSDSGDGNGTGPRIK